MSLKFKGLKIIAICVLVAFATIALRVDLLAAPKAKPQPTVEKKVTSAAQFQDLLKDTEKLFEGMDADLGKKKDVTPRLAQLRQHRSDLQAQADNIRGELAKTRQELISKKLPAEIIQRHDAFAQNFETNMKALYADLDQAEQAKSGQLQARVKAARDYLKKNIHRERHIPLDPNKLPNSVPKIERKEPRLKKKDFERDFLKPQKSEEQRKPILVASNGPLTGLLASNDEQDTGNLIVAQATNQPTADDLAETVEIKFTKEIDDILENLDRDPVKIYEYVKNNFDYEPYYGSVKGSQETLLEQSGNDLDLASLSIALFRAAGIPARYVYGTIEIPIEQAQKWLKVKNPLTAVPILASNGIPAKNVISGGIVSSILLEHVWVEVYLPYGDYRGETGLSTSNIVWIPLDPSFKQYEFNPQSTNFYRLINFSSTDFFQEYYSTSHDKTPGREYVTRIKSFFLNNNSIVSFFKSLSIAQLGGKLIELLPSTLEYKVITVLSKFSEINDNLRQKVSFTIDDPYLETSLRITLNIPEIIGKRLTISYGPASQNDADVINSYDGIYNTPAYLVYVKPTLKIDGSIRATGKESGLGIKEILSVGFYRAGGGHVDNIAHKITAGGYYAIGLDAQFISAQALIARSERFKNAVQLLETTPVDRDEIIGEFLNLIAMDYFHKYDYINYLVADSMQIVKTKDIAAALVGVSVITEYMWGVPNRIDVGGLSVDVPRNISAAFNINGDNNLNKDYVLLAGMTGSFLEHIILEKMLEIESVSALKALEIASTSGMEIYQVDTGNVDSIVPLLEVSLDVKDTIRNAVAAGKIAFVPQKEIQIDNWQGCGFIILDEATGSGAYLISGGLAGGSLTWVTKRLEDLIKKGYISRAGAANMIKELQTVFAPAPVYGTPNSPFAWRTIRYTKGRHAGQTITAFHRGIDIACLPNAPVTPIADGTIIIATPNEDEGYGYGKAIIIDHGAGVYSLYGHNDELFKTSGNVGEKDVIAAAGRTGDIQTDLDLSNPRAGVHVHLSIFIKAKPDNQDQPAFTWADVFADNEDGIPLYAVDPLQYVREFQGY